MRRGERLILADDAALVAGDLELAGLSLLLDEERFRARLARELPDVRLGSVRAHYLRYKPATSCLVAYRVDVDGVELAVHALAWRSGGAPRFEKAASRHLVPGLLGSGLRLWEDVFVAIWSFPNDLEVRALRRLGDADSRRRLLSRLAPERLELQNAQLSALAYKPARRFAGSLTAESEVRAAVKLYSGSAWALRANAEDRLTSGERLELPSILGRSERHRAVLLDWLPGDLLSDLLRRAELPGAALEAAGAALAELHAQSASDLPARESAVGGEGLPALAETLGRLVPERADATAAVARRLVAQLAHRASDVPVHGDLHAKQIVVDHDRIGLLDLDRSARSTRAEDLGNLLAHLERDEVLGRLAVGRAGEAAAAFLAGYGKAGVVPASAELDRERAAAMLRLAMHPFRNRDPEWRARVGLLLDRVEAAARAADSGSGR